MDAFAPGRVNLIGEHTDYNGGLALPFAIDRGVTVSLTPLPGPVVEVHAVDLGERDRFTVTESVMPSPATGPATTPTPGWRAFARGAVAEFLGAGHHLGGCRIAISSTLPSGAGLSSSAALSVALLLALHHHAGVRLPDPVALARLGQQIENQWAGADTGLLDQLASICGERAAALRIDFSALTVEPVALELGDFTLALLDSGERHANATAGGTANYNARRCECEAAADALGVRHLSQAALDDLDQLPTPLHARARHVISENDRVTAAVAALRRGDLAALGPLLDASHASLRDDFGVSTPAVERTVDAMLEAGAIGARLVGGGFGGQVLGLFAPGVAPPAGGVPVTPADGARLG